MTTAELENYRQNIVQSFEDPVVITVRSGGYALNAGDTSNRDAHGGISWINYWRAITKNYDTILHCSSCGKVIFVGELTQAQIRQNLPIGANLEDYRAHGGHIKLLPPVDAKWRRGLYITPLCPECNAKHGQRIPIRAGSILCKEVGANITEE